MQPLRRLRDLNTGVVFTTRNQPIDGLTEDTDRPAVDGYGNPLPPKFPAMRRASAPNPADEATTEANKEANSHAD